MKYFSLVIFLKLYISFYAWGQNVKIEINNLIPKLKEDEQEALKVWKSYLYSFNMKNYEKSKFWSEHEKKKYQVPDIDLVDIAIASKGFTKYYPLILNIQKIDSLFIIKTAFVDNTDSSTTIHSIYNVIVKKENGTYKMFRHFDYFSKDWLSKSYNKFKIYHNKNYIISKDQISKIDSFNHYLSSFFKTDIIPFELYIFPSTEARLKAKGYDYNYLMYNSIQVSGDVDPYSKIIYSGNGTAYFPHEMVHLYTSKLYYPVNNFFDEGVCTFLGGNLEDFETDTKNLRVFLENNKEDIKEYMFKKNSEKRTNIRYAIAAIICEITYKKLGTNGLATLLKTVNIEDETLRIIEITLGITQQNLDSFIRTYINQKKI